MVGRRERRKSQEWYPIRWINRVPFIETRVVTRMAKGGRRASSILDMLSRHSGQMSNIEPKSKI